MAAIKRLEFNVDYGLNFNSKNVEKEIAKQLKEKEQFVKEYYEKNNKMPPIKMNIDNAVDIEGSPIDKKSLDALVGKYEKAINSALKVMTEDFRKNLGSDISKTLTENISKEFDTLFSNIENLIIEKCKDLQSRIGSAVSSVSPVTIDAADLVKVDASSTDKTVKQIEKEAEKVVDAQKKVNKKIEESQEETKDISANVSKTKGRKKKKTDDGILDQLSDDTKRDRKTVQEYSNDLAEFITQGEEVKKELGKVEEIIKDINDKKAELEKKLNKKDDFKAKLGKKTYTSDDISNIKKDKDKAKAELEDLFNQYADAYVRVDDITEEEDEKGSITKKLENERTKLENKKRVISQIMQQISSTQKEIAEIIKIPKAYEEVLQEIYSQDMIDQDIIDSDVMKAEKSIEVVKAELKGLEEELEYVNKQKSELNKKFKAIQDSVSKIKENPKYSNTNMNTGDVQIGENSKGMPTAYVGVNVYTTVNQESFTKQVLRAVESVDEVLKKRPVKVPISSDVATVSEFREDIESLLRDNPVKLAIDKADVAQQVQDAVKDVNISVNGNISSLNVNNISGLNVGNVASSNNDQDAISYEDLSDWDEVNPQVQEEANEIKNIVADISSQFAEVDQKAESVADNLEKTVDQAAEFDKLSKQILQKVLLEDSNDSNVVTQSEDDYGEDYFEYMLEQAKNEAVELENETAQVEENLNQATEGAKKLKETVIQTADALVGEIKKVDNPIEKISNDKIEAYKLLDNFKPTIVRKTAEEKELEAKGDARTPAENERLKKLEWGRKQQRKRIEAEKKPVRDDWAKIEQHVEKVSVLLLNGLEELENSEKYGKLTGKKRKRLEDLEKEERFTSENKTELQSLKKKKKNELTKDEKDTIKLLTQREEDQTEYEALKKENDLTEAEKQRLQLLRNQKKWNEENTEEYHKQLDDAQKELEVQKQKSVLFGNMHNTALVEFSNEKNSKKSAESLTKKALDVIKVEKAKTGIGSQKYNDLYNSSVKKLTTKDKKTGISPLEQELEDLVKAENLWNGVNDAIKDKGREKALEDYTNQVVQLENRLKSIKDYESQVEKNYEKGIYTKQKYSEEMSAIWTEKSIVGKQLSDARHAKNIVSKVKEKEIDIIAEANRKKRILYEEDLKESRLTYEEKLELSKLLLKSELNEEETSRLSILKEKEKRDGLSSRINELRHKDIASYAQYKVQQEKQKVRVEKNRAYEKRKARYKQELMDSGISERIAEERKKEAVKGTDYSSNQKKMNEMSAQFHNVEADLQEIANLLKEIDELQNKLNSSEGMSESTHAIEAQLSEKRMGLETLIGRVGWQSKDIIDYINHKDSKDNATKKIYNLDRKSFNVKDFEKDTGSIQEVVDKIQNALDETIEVNDKLKKSIEESKSTIQNSRNTVEAHINGEIEKVRLLNEEKQRLQNEIENTNDKELKTKNDFKIGQINSQLKKLSQVDKVSKNPDQLKSYIDLMTEQLNKPLLDSLDAQQQQAAIYDKYIKDAEQELKEQTEKRKAQEPTEKELKGRNINLGKQKKSINKEYNESIEDTQNQINALEDEVSQLKPVAEEAIQAIDDEVKELNADLEKAEEHLKAVRESANTGSSKELNQTNTDSDLFNEYREKQHAYNKEYSDKKVMLDNSEKMYNKTHDELEKIYNNYRDRIKQQERVVALAEKELETQKELLAEKEKSGKKVTQKDKKELKALETKLQKEKEYAEKMKFEYDPEVEMDRKQKISRMKSIAGTIEMKQGWARDGRKGAIGYIEEHSKELVALSKETGVNFGQFQEYTLETGEKIKLINFDLSEINRELSNFNEKDIVNYRELQGELGYHDKILNTVTLPDPKIMSGIRDEYANKIKEALKLESGEDILKHFESDGEMTDEIKERLLNMQRYANEYGRVAGVKKENVNKELGIDTKLAELMSTTWKEAEAEVTSSIDKINNKQIEILEAEKEVERLRNSIDVKERSKEHTKAQVELRNKEKELEQKRKELQKLKDDQARANERISLEQEKNRNKLKEMSKDNQIEVLSDDSISKPIEEASQAVSTFTNDVKIFVDGVEKWAKQDFLVGIPSNFKEQFEGKYFKDKSDLEEAINQARIINNPKSTPVSQADAQIRLKELFDESERLRQSYEDTARAQNNLLDDTVKEVNQTLLLPDKSQTSAPVEQQVDQSHSAEDISLEADSIEEKAKAQEHLNEAEEVHLDSEPSYSDKDIELETNVIENKVEAQERLNEAEKEHLANILESSKQQFVDTKTVSSDNQEALKEIGVLTDENKNSVNELFLEFVKGLSTIEQVVDKMLQLKNVVGDINVAENQLNEQDLESIIAELSAYIKSNKVVDIKANPEELLGKYDAYMNAGGTQEGFAQIAKAKSSLVPFIQNLKNAGAQAHETAIAVTEIAQANKEVDTTATAPSAVEVQQEQAQEEIAKTNQMLQQQIAQALQAAQVSIAEGSSVNIAGSVKIDGEQFGSLSGDFTELQNVSYELLEVVKNIYTVIEEGAKNASQNIQAVQSPVSNITEEVKEAGEAIEEAEVKFSKFGDKIKVVSGGNINIGEEKFAAIKEAVDAMEEAISSDDMLKEIRNSGDITAKYISGEGADGKEQAYVRLTSVFRDTKGEIIKLNHVYDVNAGKMEASSSISAKMASKFEMQEKAIKKADAQVTYYTNKLDKLKVKYQMFNINDFGIDENGNLFAKVGTEAENTFEVITGKTKELVKEVILEMQNVENKFAELKSKTEGKALSEDQLREITNEYNLAIETFENKMNAVNRRINTQVEHTSRNWLNGFQRDYANAKAALYDSDGTIRINTDGLNQQGLAYLEQYKDALLDLEELFYQYQEQGEKFTQQQIEAWKRQMQTITDVKKALNLNSSKKYVNGVGFSQDNLSLSGEQFSQLVQDSTYARQTLKALAEQIEETDVEVVELSKDNKTLTYTFKDQNKNIQTCKISVDDYGRTIRKTTVKSAQHVGLLSRAFGTLKDKLLQITKYVSAYEIFYKFVNAIRSGIEIVKELDTAMTEMKKVSKNSTEELNKFAKASHKIAQEIGSNAATIQNSAADWMRLGYSIEEAAGLARNTAILMNISEFEDIGAATESMVAMIQAFKTEGTDVVELSTQLIDKLNNIGNNYSISTSELAESLQRSSGTLIAANNSVDEAIALTTAGNAIIQDAETTGNALKVISMRIRGTSAKALEEEGEDTEGLIETTSKLEEKVKSLTAVNGKMGVSLLDANGNYRSTYEILQDIADVWQEIGEADIADGENRQAALLEALAGKTRAQSLASILQNADMLRDAYIDVQNSEGSAAEENDVYMDSIASHLEVLKAKWQEMWDSALVRDDINWVIDRLGDILDFIKDIGGLKGALLGVLSVGAGIKIAKNDDGGGRTKMLVLIKYATEQVNREVSEL